MWMWMPKWKLDVDFDVDVVPCLEPIWVRAAQREVRLRLFRFFCLHGMYGLDYAWSRRESFISVQFCLSVCNHHNHAKDW
jgi:hypothetical protein